MSNSAHKCPHCGSSNIIVCEATQKWFQLNYVNPDDNYYDKGEHITHYDEQIDEIFRCERCAQTLQMDQIVITQETSPILTAVEDPDQPGMWLYKIDGEGSDTSYPTKDAALEAGFDKLEES